MYIQLNKTALTGVVLNKTQMPSLRIESTEHFKMRHDVTRATGKMQ